MNEARQRALIAEFCGRPTCLFRTQLSSVNRAFFPIHGSFEAELYLDHAAGGPTSVTRRKQAVSSVDTLRVVIPRAGGFAARLMRAAR